MKPHLRCLWVAVSSAIMVALLSVTDAEARTFNAIPCPSGGTELTSADGLYGLGLMSTVRWQEQSLFHVGYDYCYENNINRPWMSIFNQTVTDVSPYTYRFDTEPGYDYLSLYGSSGTSTWTGHSVPQPEYKPAVSTYRNGAATTYVSWRFVSDVSANYIGYYIPKLKVHCTTAGSPSNNFYLQRNYPYDVYLLGTNDVVYAKVIQPAGHEMSISIWPEPNATANDFDLYVSDTNSLPDPSGGYTWFSAYAANMPDIVVVPPPSGDRTLYIAVGSFGGAGKYRLYANSHSLSTSQFNTSRGIAYTDFGPSPAQKERIHASLMQESVTWYLATEGNHLIKTWDVYYNYPGGLPAGYCSPTALTPRLYSRHHYDYLSCQLGSGRIGVCPTWDAPSCTRGSYVRIPNDWCHDSSGDIDASTICDAPAQEMGDGHEFGHCIHGFIDNVGHYNGCGHSQVSNNYGISYGNKKFCTPRSGGLDEYDAADTPGHYDYQSDWSCMAGRYDNGLGFYFQAPFYYTGDEFWREVSSFEPFTGLITITDH